MKEKKEARECEGKSGVHKSINAQACEWKERERRECPTVCYTLRRFIPRAQRFALYNKIVSPFVCMGDIAPAGSLGKFDRDPRKIASTDIVI